MARHGLPFPRTGAAVATVRTGRRRPRAGVRTGSTTTATGAAICVPTRSGADAHASPEQCAKTRIMVMTTTTSMAGAKGHLSAIAASAELTRERTIITKNGRPAAIIIGIDDFEGMEMTMEILRDPVAMEQIRVGVAAVARGSSRPSRASGPTSRRARPRPIPRDLPRHCWWRRPGATWTGLRSVWR